MGAAVRPSPRRRPRVIALLDEHDAAGGRVKAAVMLCHPGPSLLVTAMAVVAAGLVTGAVPSPATVARLVMVMLPAQCAIGAANDRADVEADRLTQPHKPLVRGAVSTNTATGVAVAGALISLAVALTASPASGALAAVGLGAGLAYDLRLKRTPFALVAWWAGFTALPLWVAAMTSSLRPSLLSLLPLTALLALLLHLANSLPDLDGDRSAGVRSLPVLVGAGWSRVLVTAASVSVALLVLLLPVSRGERGGVLTVTAAGLAVAGVGLMAHAGWALRSFPPLAILAAAVGVAWLTAVPR